MTLIMIAFNSNLGQMFSEILWTKGENSDLKEIWEKQMYKNKGFSVEVVGCSFDFIRYFILPRDKHVFVFMTGRKLEKERWSHRNCVLNLNDFPRNQVQLTVGGEYLNMLSIANNLFLNWNIGLMNAWEGLVGSPRVSF